MSAVKKPDLISVEDYLAGELISPIKHEYVAGEVYAMAGARNLHNRVASRLHTALGVALRGKPCEPYNSDTKVHVRFPTHERFYYPDLQVVCHSNPDEDSFQDAPIVVCEVLSKSTRRIDEREKKDAYLTLPSLSVYLLIEQDKPKIVTYRRTGDDFVREVYEGLDAVIPLSAIDCELRLADVYQGLELTPETE
jgi:Uma2 family endonuclease